MDESMNSNNHTISGSPWTFMLLTFSISWLIWLPGVLSATKLIPLHLSNTIYGILNLVGGFGPTIAGLILTYHQEGKKGLKQLFHRVIKIKSIGKQWWIPILFIIPIIQGGAVLISVLFGGTIPESPLLLEPWLIPFYIVIASTLPIAAPIREEFGWRGYALDRIQVRWNALLSSIILGIFWGVWHFPLFVFPTTQIIYGYIPLWVLIIDATVLSIMMTWVYNNTERSLLSAIIIHAVMDVFSGSVFLYYKIKNGIYFNLILQILFIIIIISLYGYKTMVRFQKDIA